MKRVLPILNKSEHIAYPFIPDFNPFGVQLPSRVLDATEVGYTSVLATLFNHDDVDKALTSLTQNTNPKAVVLTEYTDTKFLQLQNDVLLDATITQQRRLVGPVTLDEVTYTATEAIFTFKYVGSEVSRLPHATGDTPTHVFAQVIVPANFAGTSYATEVIVSDNDLIDLRADFVFGTGVKAMCAATEGRGLRFKFYNVFLEPTRVMVLTRHKVPYLTSLTGHKVSGDVALRDGYNFRVSVANGKIRLGAEKGAGRGKSCEQFYREATPCTDMIFGINGLLPNWHGEFKLEGGDGITVTPRPDQNKVVLTSNIKTCVDAC